MVCLAVARSEGKIMKIVHAHFRKYFTGHSQIGTPISGPSPVPVTGAVNDMNGRHPSLNNAHQAKQYHKVQPQGSECGLVKLTEIIDDPVW